MAMNASWERIVGVNGLRLLLDASQVLWFARELEQHKDVVLRPYQPGTQRSSIRACTTCCGGAGAAPVGGDYPKGWYMASYGGDPSPPISETRESGASCCLIR